MNLMSKVFPNKQKNYLATHLAQISLFAHNRIETFRFNIIYRKKKMFSTI